MDHSRCQGSGEVGTDHPCVATLRKDIKDYAQGGLRPLSLLSLGYRAT